MNIRNLLAILLLAIGISTQAQVASKGLLTKFSIEGTQDTEMGTFGKSKGVDNFNERIIAATLSSLQKQFQLDSIGLPNEFRIQYKQGLNRLAGVGKLNKTEKQAAAAYKYTFIIKCDIAFNETVGGFIIDQTSSRGEVYVNIGVYDSTGERKAIYKGKCKDAVVFLGKNAHRVQWMSKEDFETAYLSALDNLKLK